MLVDKRKHRRKPLLFPGQIDVGSGLEKQSCHVTDLSAGGAKLVLQSAAELPDEFTLFLKDAAKRFCKVMWRRDSEVGVKFVAR